MANEPLIPAVPFLPREPKDADDLMRWAKETQAALRENHRMVQKRLEELNLTGTPAGRELPIAARRFYWNEDTQQLEHDPAGVWATVGDPRPGIAQGRLTTEAGVPISTADRAAQAYLYYTPYAGNKIALIDPTSRNMLMLDQGVFMPEDSGLINGAPTVICGWNRITGPETISLSTTTPWQGSNCLQVVCTNVGQQGVLARGMVGVTAATNYTLSAHLRASAGAPTVNLRMEWWNSTGGLIATSVSGNLTLSTAWQRFTYTVASPALSVTCRVSVITNPAAAVTFYLDGVQFEQAAAVTPWVPGRWWKTITFSEKSISVNPSTAGKCYDVFGYIDASGNLALEREAWASATVRNKGPLPYGIGVNTGWDITRRYLGTYFAYAANETADAAATRYVWNMDNRVPRNLWKVDATAHAYGAAVWRYWNNSSAHCLSYCQGLPEDATAVEFNVNANADAGVSWIAGLAAAMVGTYMITLMAPNTTHGTALGAAMHVPGQTGLYQVWTWEYSTGANSNFSFYRMAGAVLA